MDCSSYEGLARLKRTRTAGHPCEDCPSPLSSLHLNGFTMSTTSDGQMTLSDGRHAGREQRGGKSVVRPS